MKKILFILNTRAGSNLFLFLMGYNKIGSLIDHKNKTLAEYGSEYATLINPYILNSHAKTNNWTGTKESFWLSTKSSYICPCENYYAKDPVDTLATNPPFDVFSWYVYMGDWWGVTETHHQIPEPYELETFSRFSYKELNNLPGKDWKFVYIIRDGRNQLESLWNIPGGYEAERIKKDAVDFFLVLCKGWRNRARIAIDCDNMFPNFKLIKFEDFIQDPIGQLVKIYDFIDLKPNLELINQSYIFINKENYQDKHSSFEKNHNVNQRWHQWTEWKKETFYNIAGKELKELGYV